MQEHTTDSRRRSSALRFPRQILVGAISLAASLSTLAQESIDEIRITGQTSKTDVPIIEWPRSVSVIDAARIDEQNASSLAQALRYTPGIVSEPFGFEPRLTFMRIRGFDASETGLFRDGVRLSNPGFVVSYNLEPYGAEQLEVPRGPASVLYGQTSPGGLIDYISKQPAAESLGEIDIELGSHERRQLRFDASGPVDEGDRFRYRFTGLLRDSDSQVDYLKQDRTYLAPALTWRPGNDTDITFMAHWQEDDTRASQALPAQGTLFDSPEGRIPLTRFTGEPSVDRYQRDELSAGVLLNHQFNQDWEFRQNLRYYQIDLEDVSVFSASVIDARTLGRSLFENFGELDGLSLDNRLLGRIGRHDLFIGADYRRYDSTSLQFFGGAPSLDLYDPQYGATVTSPETAFKNEEAKQEQFGLYIQDQFHLSDALVLSLGGRFDSTDNESMDEATGSRNEQTDEELVTNAGLVYVMDNGLAPYASYSESFLSVLGSDSDGNAFDPELGEQVEAGVKYQPDGNLLVTLAAFDLTRENFTQFDPDTFLPVQTGEVSSRGVEFQAAARLRTGLDISISLTDLDVEITRSIIPGEQGERPTQVPERTGSVWLSQDFQGGLLSGLDASVGVRYLGASFGDTPNTLKTPSETLVDLDLHYDWNDLRFRLNVQNLFDEEYIASTFVRGGTDFATYGQTRRVTGSVRYEW